MNLALFGSVDLDSGGPIVYWWRCTPGMDDPDVIWYLAPRFGADQFTAYTPADSDVWDGDPTTIAEALDRIAAVVGDTVPIP